MPEIVKGFVLRNFRGAPVKKKTHPVGTRKRCSPICVVCTCSCSGQDMAGLGGGVSGAELELQEEGLYQNIKALLCSLWKLGGFKSHKNLKFKKYIVFWFNLPYTL